MAKNINVAHPEFGLRMLQACENNSSVPPLHHGRLGWFVKEFANCGTTVTRETVRKWFSGESYPRKKAMTTLSSILDVDEAWLAVGQSPGLSQKQVRVRNAMAGGAVNLVAGMIQMDGGHVAFPDEKDSRARTELIDLYAIIKGAQYALHVSVGILVEGDWTFRVPLEALSTFILGVMPVGNMHFQLVELDGEGVEAVGVRKGGTMEVLLPRDDFNWNWKQIKTFSERL